MYAYAATSGEAKTFTYNLGTYYMYAYAATSGKAKVKILLLYAQDLYIRSSLPVTLPNYAK